MKKDKSNQKRKSNRKLTKAIFRLFCLTFLSLIFAIGIANFLTKDKAYSENENRSLAAFPKFSLASITDATFMKNFETYLNDQFIFRDLITEVKSKIDFSIGKREQNDVYIGSDGFLFQKQSEFDETKIKALCESLTKFSNEHKNLKQSVILPPNSTHFYKENLPQGLKLDSQFEQLKSIYAMLNKSKFELFNVTKTMLNVKADTQLFYKTDHHWSTRAAYEVFLKLAEIWNLDVQKNQFEFHQISSSFSGTLSSSSGIKNTLDTIEICTPKNSAGSYVVDYVQENKSTSSIFQAEKLDTKNQYEVFLGGNFAKVEISTISKSDNTLLLVKDSFANCMIPMLTPFFEKIVIIDPRYYTENLTNLMQDENFTHLLFIYNLNTFLTDNSLIDTLK